MSVPSKAEDNVAFKVKEFNIAEFQGDTIEISLRQSKDNRRRKRAIEVYALVSDATYRTAQLNTDESGVSYKAPLLSSCCSRRKFLLGRIKYILSITTHARIYSWPRSLVFLNQDERLITI
jgi:hypothetical protein